MTLILSWVTPKHNMMAGDDLLVYEDYSERITTPKVWREGEFLFGGSGSWGLLQTVRWHMREHAHTLPVDFEDVLRWTVGCFREVIEGVHKHEDGAEANILVGGKGRHGFAMSTLASAEQSPDMVISTGSGAAFADGYLAGAGTKWKPGDLFVECSLRVGSVGPDFKTESVLI